MTIKYNQSLQWKKMADREGEGEMESMPRDDEEEKEEEGEEDGSYVLDLSNSHLTSLDDTERQRLSTLILDNNDLVKLDGIENYSDLEQLSVSNNRIVRMLGLNALSKLSVLCLSNNSIVAIEGIAELSHLTWLDLSSNSIKIIEHLPMAGHLYYIDLSDNEVSAITDMSKLTKLKTLLLHGNNISTLKTVLTHLPPSLTILSLADNGIYDLNEISYLSCLPELQQLSMSDNPCLMMTGDQQGFDYRPFVWNWSPSLAVLDGFMVAEKERLLGEWLYSQGKGRHFHPGQHAQLVEYLASTCPLTSSEQLRTEEDSHLSQVLNQQRRYRQQLQQPHGYNQYNHSHHHQPHQHTFATVRSDGLSSPRLGDSLKSNASEANTLEKESSINTANQSYEEAPGAVQQTHKQYWAAPTDQANRLHSTDRLASTHDGLTLQEISNDDAKSSESLLESESVYLPFDVPASPIIQRRPFTAPEKRSQAFIKSPPIPVTTGIGKPPASAHHAPLNGRPATATDARHSKFSSLEHRPIKPLNQNLNKGSHRPSFEISPPVTSQLEPSVCQISDTQLSTACSQDYDSSSEPVSECEPSAKPDNAHVNSVQNKDNVVVGTNSMSAPLTPPKEKLNLIKSVIGSKKSAQATGSSVTEKSKAATNVKSVAFSMKTSRTNKTNTTTTAPSMAAAAVLRSRYSKGNAQQPTNTGSNANEQGDNSSIASGVKNSSVELRSQKRELGESKHMKGKLNLEKMELRKDGGSFGSVRDSGFLSRPSSDAVEDVQLHEPDHKAAIIIQARWRGYWAREYNTKVVSVRKEIRARRAEDHIMLLRKDLERNQKLYEEEKRLRVLQMEAIRILYQEVQMLKSQTTNSVNDFNSTGGNPENSNSLTATNFSTATATTCSELNRTQELERTCAGLQRQVSHLQESLESVSSAVFRSNSLDGTSFDLIDTSQAIQVTPHTLNSSEHRATRDGESSCWGLIPHSLSPYPSEEEEQYYLQFPSYGTPTPPRRLQLYHHSRNSLVLSWQSSSCPGTNLDDEGNKHIIGYRVYVNDQLRAFVCQRTSAMVNGLNPISTYKFYVKALSGFGESFQSNIIMAKLAKGNERHKYSGSSGSDSSADSDKDIDSTETNERHRHRNRKPRKSPRSGEKKKSSRYGMHRRVEFSEGMSELQEGSSSGLNQNNSAALMHSPILTHPKLHTHRRNRSKDMQYAGDFLGELSNKSTSSPGAGGATSASGEVSVSPVPLPVSSHPSHHRESARKLPESPLAGSGKEKALILDTKEKLITREASTESKSKHSVVGDSPDGSGSVKKESPPVGSFKRLSPTHPGRKETFVFSDTTKTPGGGSANVSPVCGSEGEQKQRISPKSGKDIIPSKVSPPCGSLGIYKTTSSQSSSMSETFTIDKAHSFLQGVSAITENVLAPKFVGSGAPHDKGHRISSGASRGHRRTRSKDYQLQSEKSRSTPELTSVVAERKHFVESEQDCLTVEEAMRLGIGKVHSTDKDDSKDTSKTENDTIVDVSSKTRGHRRKRSRDLNQEGSEVRKEENVEGNVDERREDLKSDQRKGREVNPGKPEEGNMSTAVLQSSKEPSHSQAGRPVLDGRRRHSSGSGPSSPVIMAGDKPSGEDKIRVSVAEQLERYKSLKSSSLNSLSGRSEEGSRQEIDKRTPSSESLPASSYKGDSSKRTPSNESLLSGGSSRGESSKRTQSSDSLMSIRTDTSKRSHSNESLPGSARTDPSRRSPSNESLPESIREENETELSESGKSSQPPQGCRRSQSMGSARDIARSVAGGDSASSSAPRSSSSVMSKLLLKLESITRNNSSSVKETKKSLMKRSKNEDNETAGSKPPSDDERRSGRRSRNHSESDAEGGTSDPGSQLPPRAPSESSSGSHSDDNRHSRRGHQRTPSDHRQPSSLPMEADPTRPMHSPIIMEGATVKKSGSSVRRNQSFHGLLPSKHQDAKASPSSTEDISSKPEEQNATQTQTQTEAATRTRSHLRSRTPSPARNRQPVLSAAQLKRHSDSGSKSSMDPASGKSTT